MKAEDIRNELSWCMHTARALLQNDYQSLKVSPLVANMSDETKQAYAMSACALIARAMDLIAALIKVYDPPAPAEPAQTARAEEAQTEATDDENEKDT